MLYLIQVHPLKKPTHGAGWFLADDHLFDLHDLRHVVGAGFELADADALVDAAQHVVVDVLSRIQACRQTL